jgi:hypothetical protein
MDCNMLRLQKIYLIRRCGCGEWGVVEIKPLSPLPTRRLLLLLRCPADGRMQRKGPDRNASLDNLL